MTSAQYILFTLPLCTLLLAGGFAACARWRPGRGDLQWMAAGFLLFSVGVLSQIMRLPEGLDDSAVVSAVIYHASAGCIAQAVALRHGVRLDGWAGVGVAALALTALMYYAYVDYNLFARIYVLNFGLGAQLGISSWRVVRVRPAPGLDRALWWLFGLFVLSFFVRTVLTIPQAHGLTDSSFAQTPFWIALYLSLLVFALLFAMLYLAAAVRDAFGQLQRERNQDALTELLNRRAFLEAVAHPRHAEQAASLLLIDVDYFKQVNDRWGHAAGDAVLHSIAQVLLRTVRQGDLVARFGGEEFVVLLYGLSPSAAVLVAQRIQRELVHTRYAPLPEEQRVRISCGIAAMAQGREVEPALAQADRLLYAAKAAGRNCVCWLGAMGPEIAR